MTGLVHHIHTVQTRSRVTGERKLLFMLTAGLPVTGQVLDKARQLRALGVLISVIGMGSSFNAGDMMQLTDNAGLIYAFSDVTMLPSEAAHLISAVCHYGK